jgi:hypothetical protein
MSDILTIDQNATTAVLEAHWPRPPVELTASALSSVQPPGASGGMPGAAPALTIDGFIGSIPALPVNAAQPAHVVFSSPTKAFDDGVLSDITTTTWSETSSFTDLVAFDPNADALWPGSLVQAQSLLGGVLAPIGLGRSPMSITLTTSMFPQTGSPTLSRRLDHPSLSSAQAAMYDILSSVAGSATPAKLTFLMHTADSLEQGLLDVGVNAKWLSGSVAGNLTLKRSNSRSSVAVRFIQAYYTLAAEPPASPTSVFDPTVTLVDCHRYMGPGNPPAYIASVTYGRMLVFLFESSKSSDELKAAVNAAFQSGSTTGQVNVKAEYTDTLNQSTVQVLALGGGAGYAIQMITGDVVSGLKGYLQDGAHFSRNSPGVPISFTTRYLKDNSVAAVSATTQWTQTSVVGHPAAGTYTVTLGKGARSGRVDTGIVVRKGDILSIQGDGQVWSGVLATGANGPNGWYTWAKPGQPGFPNMSAHPFSLLYAVGDTDQPTYAGDGINNRQYDGATGDLLLMINTNNYDNGNGHFTVTVTVQRRQQV